MLHWKVPPQKKITGLVDEATQFTDLASDIRQIDNLYPVLSVKANHLYANRCFAHPKKPRWCSQILLIYRKLAGMPTPWKSKTKQRMVFRMIHIKDSLLPMGKVWSLDSLATTINLTVQSFTNIDKWCPRATRIPI